MKFFCKYESSKSLSFRLIITILIFILILYNNLHAQEDVQQKNPDANPTLNYSPATVALAKSNFYFLVEGRTAAKLNLGFSQTQFEKVWQKPLRNSFENPQTLSYLFNDIEFTLILKNGRIKEIHYFVTRAYNHWFTALGVDASLLRADSAQENMEILAEHYKKQKIILRYTMYPSVIDFTSLGIRYHFSKHKLYRIDIYQDSLPEVRLPPIYKK